MKKNYLKSIGFVLLGIIMSSIIFSFSPNESSLIENHKEQNKNWVHFEKAQQEIGAYQMWLKLLPKTVKFDYVNKKIIFQDTIDILEEDLNVLKTYCIRYLKTNESVKTRGMTNEEIIDSIMKKPFILPFHAKLDHSYFIKREDLKEALKDCSMDGINVYLAMTGLDSLKLDSIKSHVYVVPAKKIYDEQSKDSILVDKLVKDIYALDLTEPCPNLCAKSSPFYEPTLEPIKK